MNLIILYLQLIFTAIFTAIACCIPGTFLILRGTSLISDAISHAIFLGIVISFLAYQQFYTPVLFVGATITALVTIWIIEKIIATKRLHADAIIGITFPFLFSIAVILINLYAQNIHLDIDAVLLGELAFSPFYQMKWYGVPIGSWSLWTMFMILLGNICTLVVWYRQLITTTFDTDFASIIEYQPKKTYWVLMTMTCVTILGAFEAVGAILVVAFIIIPPAIASLLTKKIFDMLIIAIFISILGSLTGCLMANLAQTSIAGSITTTFCLFFMIAYFGTKQTVNR